MSLKRKIDNKIIDYKENKLINEAYKLAHSGFYKLAMDKLPKYYLQKEFIKLIKNTEPKEVIFCLLPHANSDLLYELLPKYLNELPNLYKFQIIKYNYMELNITMPVIESYSNSWSINPMLQDFAEINRLYTDDKKLSNYHEKYFDKMKNTVLDFLNKNINDTNMIPTIFSYYNKDNYIEFLPNRGKVIELIYNSKNIKLITNCLPYVEELRSMYIDLVKESDINIDKKEEYIMSYAFKYDNKLLEEFDSVENLFLAIYNLKASKAVKEKMVLKVYDIVTKKEMNNNYSKYIDEAKEKAKENLDALIKPGIFSVKN